MKVLQLRDYCSGEEYGDVMIGFAVGIRGTLCVSVPCQTAGLAL
jgi:hypothetical protein